MRARVDDLVREAIKPVDAAMQSLFKQGLPPVTLLGSIQESVRTFGRGLELQFEGFRRMFEDYEALERQARPALRRSGWLILPSWPMYFVIEVLGAAANDDVASVERVILARYRKKRSKLLALETRRVRLAEVTTRRALIAQAVRAHQLKLWAVTVPFLVAQIEGVVRDFAEAELVRIGKRIARRSGKPRAESVVRVLKRIPESDDFREELLDTLGELFTGGVLDRNAVLHGRDVAYATEAHSLRCFVVLLALDDHLIGVREALASRSRAVSA